MKNPKSTALDRGRLLSSPQQKSRLGVSFGAFISFQIFIRSRAWAVLALIKTFVFLPRRLLTKIQISKSGARGFFAFDQIRGCNPLCFTLILKLRRKYRGIKTELGDIEILGK